MPTRNFVLPLLVKVGDGEGANGGRVGKVGSRGGREVRSWMVGSFEVGRWGGSIGSTGSRRIWRRRGVV